jgi:hypothetical protein
VYLPGDDAYRCPAGERLPYRYTNEEDGKMLRRYWTTACQNCSLKPQCTRCHKLPAGIGARTELITLLPVSGTCQVWDMAEPMAAMR